MKELCSLFMLFFRLGAVTFGGGYAMLPLLQRELVEKRGWVTDSELADYYAIGQCTPGVISVNTATFVGNKRKGIAGGIAATLGFVTPSIIIISIIAAFVRNFADLAVVQHAFSGIRVCVCVLILVAVQKLLKSAIVDMKTWILFGVIFILAVLTDISPVWFVLGAGFIGLLVFSKKGAQQ